MLSDVKNKDIPVSWHVFYPQYPWQNLHFLSLSNQSGITKESRTITAELVQLNKSKHIAVLKHIQGKG
jgi:hypothetical protein